MNATLTRSIKPQFRTIHGVRIRYAESGGPQERTLLLTSPWPESLFAFAPMWATLAEDARLFAVDLPGFGRSERRDDLLSPRAMGGFLARLIAEADLGTPHIVAPDAQIRIYPDAAHGFLFQYPTKVAADVNAFLVREGSVES
jgi:pimeloyl-ACP methyl ester carboxylesterase